jgi:hypothetical protein
LIDLTLDQIFEGIASLEPNPFKVWDLIEKHYKKNFFENVIIKRYASLFDNKEVIDFVQGMSEVRTKVIMELSTMSK